MIIEHTPQGEIFHVIDDPVPPGLVDALRDNGSLFAEFPPVPLPEEPFVDEVTGVETMASPGYTFTECDIATQWFDGTGIADRPTLDLPTQIEMSVGEVVQLQVPEPCRVILDGKEHTVTDGSLELTADMPATYQLQVAQFPYHEHFINVMVR